MTSQIEYTKKMGKCGFALLQGKHNPIIELRNKNKATEKLYKYWRCEQETYWDMEFMVMRGRVSWKFTPLTVFMQTIVTFEIQKKNFLGFKPNFEKKKT